MSKIKSYIASHRLDYTHSTLNEDDVNPDPLLQFETWLDEAVQRAIPEPYAMTLATASKEGVPNARIILLRGYDEKGLIFYTNYESEKGKELENNPRAALVFFWQEIERQVRIQGRIEKVTEKESDHYFKSRPRESRIGSWASAQSSMIKDRKELEKIFSKEAEKFDGKEVSRPQFWGGYRLLPERFEFWQGRENRLHDRIVYHDKSENNWKISRLSP